MKKKKTNIFDKTVGHMTFIHLMNILIKMATGVHFCDVILMNLVVIAKSHYTCYN